LGKERKYSDHEVREILDLAIGKEDAPARAITAANGLTLTQLQEVGREVGLPPQRVAQAVAAFEGRGQLVPRGKSLGLPVSVGSVVPLPRSLSDREWELLIAELRTTFGVKGEVTSHGNLREWSHGTLQAVLEPTETGYRLRLADTSLAVGGIALGGMFLAFALLIFVVLLGKVDPGAKFAVPVFFSLVGGGLIGGTAMMVPGWAREQEKRMKHIGSYAVSLLAAEGAQDAG
jgi:plasmid stability protein